MKTVSFISSRFNAGRTLPRSIRAMRAVAVAGVSIAVAALVVATSIGRGFEGRYRRALLDFNAHVIVLGSGEMEAGGAPAAAIDGARYASDGDRRFAQRSRWLLPWRGRFPSLFDAFGRICGAAGRWVARLSAASRQGVVGETPFLYREALAVGGGRIMGVVVKGVDPETMAGVNGMPIHLFGASASLGAALAEGGGAPAAVAGRALANAIGAGEGPRDLRLLIPREGKGRAGADAFQKVRIVGTFESGMHDYDAQFLLMALPAARGLFGTAPGAVTGIEIKLDDPEKAEAVAAALGEALGPRHSVVTWGELNRDLLSAVRLEQLVSSLIMGIMVIVAALNIVAVLVLMAIHRLHEIALLRALGLSGRSVQALFVRGGSAIGAAGAIFGLAAGTGISLALGRLHLVPLEAEIYLIPAVPVDISPSMCGIIAIFCWGVGYATSKMASRRLAAVPIAEGLHIQ